jgi:hypothetical protein
MATGPLVTSREERAGELKQALLKVVPVLFSLLLEAARAEPNAAYRIYRRLGRALAILLYWNLGRLLRFPARRQYMVMNLLLRQLVVLVSDCQAVLECHGDEACLLDAADQADTLL